MVEKTLDFTINRPKKSGGNEEEFDDGELAMKEV